MTREEAIKHLSEWMDEKMWRCFGTIDREAIGMAIKALSEPSGDLIRRADTIEILCKSCRHDDKEHYYPNCVLQMCCDDINAINELPSADTDMSEYCDRLWKIAYERGKAESEAKTGEWVEHIGGISHELYYFCDQCYGEVDTNDYNFFPNCGARMKGGDDE